MSATTKWIPLDQVDETAPTPRPLNGWVIQSGGNFYLLDGFESDDTGQPVAGRLLQDGEVVKFYNSMTVGEQDIAVSDTGEVGQINWPKSANGAWVPFDPDTGAPHADGLREVLADLGPGVWTVAYCCERTISATFDAATGTFVQAEDCKVVPNDQEAQP